VELRVFRLGPGVELVEQVGQLRRVGEIDPQRLAPVLEQDRPPSVLENGIAQRIALVGLFPDLRLQIVVRILGFPVTLW
jgi:hypothetical protein